VFGVNDVFDHASDLRNPRKSGLEGGVLDPVHHEAVLRTAIMSSLFIVTCAMITHSHHCILASTVLVLLGWQYSAPPLRLKEVPLLDSATNGAIIFLAYFSGFGFGASPAGGGTVVKSVGLRDVPSKGYVLALCAAGVHALGAVADVEADIAAGQMTLAVALAKRPAALFAATCYLAALTLTARINEDPLSVFGVYIMGGLFINLATVINVGWAHRAFQGIVYWSIASVLVWFGVKACSVRTSLKTD